MSATHGRKRQKAVYSGTFLVACVLCTQAHAQTLSESVHQAIQTNPTLAVDAARLRAAGAELTVARAAGLPTLSVDASVSYNFQPIALEFSTPRKNANADAIVSVPLYQGGSVKHSIRAAQWSLAGSEDQVKSGTSALIANVGAAYVQLLAARENLDISKQYVSEIETGLLATKRRFQAGELTKTDIAQSQTSLDDARVNYESAKSNFHAALQQYIYYVGSTPKTLFDPPSLIGLPSSADEAWAMAVAHNTDLAAAESSAKAAHENTASVAGSRLPKVRAFGVASYVNYLGSSESLFFGNTGEQIYKTGQVGLQISFPIYQGGAIRGQIQNARALETEVDEQLRDSKNELRREIVASYAQLVSLRRELTISDEQIVAAGEAVYGVKRLNALGSRTVQDVLNAEQALLSAKNQQIQIKTELYIAELSILSKSGALSTASFDSATPSTAGLVVEPGD